MKGFAASLGMANETLDSFLRKRPTYRDRIAQGKRLRQEIPRATLRNFNARAKRQLPISILRAQAATRISELIPIRHARMARSPFAFFRGGAAIMAHDLAPLPSPKIMVQLCGDMHVCNFGFFSTTERHLVFGINDFDETLPGHFDWDLKRLTASAMIAGIELGQDHAYGEMLIRNICKAYRDYMSAYAQMPFIELARTYIDEDSLLSNYLPGKTSSRGFLKKQIAKARKNTNQVVIDKLTHDTPHGRRIIDNVPLVSHHDKTYRGDSSADLLDQGLKSYSKSLLTDRRHVLMRYRLIDFARKVVGVGSVGTGCWILYMEGMDQDDPLFLQYKQAQHSVLSPYFPDRRFISQGERVAHGQRLIQGAPDIFLGYGKTKQADFYMRQLRDMKGGMSFGQDGIGVNEFPDYAKLFGWALANAHARSGDPAVLTGYCGKSEQLDDALVQFATAYCVQNEADYETFLKAIKVGKLPCATENY